MTAREDSLGGGAAGSKPEPTANVSDFAGRARELELLRAALQGVLDGSGRLVLISGEPGAGKTRTAEELTRAARGRSVHIAWGRCWEEDGAPDLWPWLQVIRTCLRAVDDVTLRDLIGPHGGELTALVARDGQEMTPESPAARFRLYNAIAHFLDRYSERTPLVVVLDDLHRADPSSLLLLQFLTQEQRQRRILLIATYREPGAPANRALTQTIVEATREPGTERLHLAPLDREETTELLRRRLGWEPPAELVDGLRLRTGGNPLFLAECARQLGPRRERSEAGAHLPIPAELREVIERRLAPLSVEQREMLRHAAVVGGEFRRAAVAAIAVATASPVPESGGRDALTAALDAAASLGLLLRSDADSYRFCQGMVHEVLLDEVPLAQRLPPPPSSAPPTAPHEAARIAPPPASGGVFRREGEYWTISFAGRTCRIRDVKGLSYVALLLRYPRKPLHASELVRLEGSSGEPSEAHAPELGPARADLGDAGVLLDSRAKAEYRRRLDDLRAELEQAEEFHDTGRAERAQQEIEFLTQELSAAVGFGGRDRRAGSAVERARVNVTRSIARAIDRIGESHPDLALYLGRTIKTGTFCTYLPDASVSASWEF